MEHSSDHTHFIRLTSKKTLADCNPRFLCKFFFLIGKSGRKLIPKPLLNLYSARAQSYIQSNPANVNWMKVPADVNVRFIRILIERVLVLNKEDYSECVKALEWFQIEFEGGELWKG